MSFDEEFLDLLLASLRQVRLEAVLIGNVAASLQGAPVLTQDTDLLVRDTPLNRKKISALAKALGGCAPELVSELSTTHRIIGARVPVDILFDQMSGGLDFESVRSRSVKAKVGRETATVAALEDIIRSKEAAGRPKDLAQLPILRDTLRVRSQFDRKRR